MVIARKKLTAEKKQILELAQFLNLTKVQVAVHQNMLYKLDTKFLIVNKTLVTTLSSCNPL